MNISVFLFDLGYEKTFDYSRKKKRKNSRIPVLNEISINVAQSRARHPVINPTLLSQFLATSLPSFPFHLYERLGKDGEREIDRNFFFSRKREDENLEKEPR